MTIARHLQPSFAGGEYSPEVAARVDIDRYRIGLRTCRNFVVHPHGGASNRGGLRMIAKTKYQNKKSRMVKFIFSTTQAYQLEVGEGYIRFYKNRAQIQASGVAAYNGGTAYVVGNFVTYLGVTYYCIQSGTGHTPNSSPTYWTAQTIYEVPTPYTEADLPLLRFEESADVIYIMHPSYQQRTLTRMGDASWDLELYSSSDGPFLDENTDVSSTLACSALTGTITMAAANAIFTTGQVGGLWKVTHYVPAQIASVSLSGTGQSASIGCFTTWRIITHGTWTGKFQIEKSTDGGATWTALREFSAAGDFNANTSGTEDISTNLTPFLVRLNVTALSSGTINADLSTDPYYQDGIVRIASFVDTKHVTATVLQSIASTASTFTWAEGAWSNYRGWPTVARFFQDRLVFAGSSNNPDTDWMTQTGNYVSFRRNTIQLLDTDGITTNLTTRQLNAINGLLAFKRLLVLTSSASWSIGPVSGAALTPTSIDQEVEEYKGSEGIEPVVIGNEAIFIQTHAKIVRSIVFQLAYNGFTGNEINIFSRHMFKDYPALQMAYQENPDSIVWFLRSDGKLVALTYMKEQDVVAWHRHDTNGTIESISVIPGNGYDELWVTVNRPNGRFVEVMEDRIINDVRKSFFVDNGISIADTPLTISGATQSNPVVLTITGHGLSNGDIIAISDVAGMTDINGNQYKVAGVTTNTVQLTDAVDGSNIDGTEFDAYVSGGYARKCFNTFTGLDYLNGMTVSILGDGFVFPQQVVSGGTITLNRYCALVNIGLQYLPDFETLTPELSVYETPPPSGTMQGRKIKIGGVVFNFANSRGGWLGPAEFDQYGKLALKEGFIPRRKNFDGTLGLYTGFKRQALGGSYDTGGHVFFRQYDPLPVTILSVIPEIAVGGITPNE